MSDANRIPEFSDVFWLKELDHPLSYKFVLVGADLLIQYQIRRPALEGLQKAAKGKNKAVRAQVQPVIDCIQVQGK